MSSGVSFVVPVHNAAAWIDEVVAAIVAEDDGRPFELLLIDDGSDDGSSAILQRWSARAGVRVLAGPRRGAAAAINFGIAQAIHPIIAQVDHDVVVRPGWLRQLAAELDDPTVAAAQGFYVTDGAASLWARAMGFELMHRYSRMRAHFVDHVCTGNTVYRAEALREVGLFDESLGYGYDNDMSYRLACAGHRLAFCREALSLHRWRERAGDYLRQQYGFGFGRMDLVAKHRGRFGGDDVSGVMMMAHAPLMLLALVLFAVGGGAALLHRAWQPAVLGGAALVALLAAERWWAGVQAWRRFGNSAGFFFAPVHLLRDLAWAAAMVAWTGKRLTRGASRPSDSM